MGSVTYELSRLQGIYDACNVPFTPAKPATGAELESIYKVTGVQPTDEFFSLFQFANGSNGQGWFLDYSELGRDEFDEVDPEYALFEVDGANVYGVDPEVPKIYQLYSISKLLDNWKSYEPYDEKHYQKWYDDEQYGERDQRIQRHLLKHSEWIPFAQIGGTSDEFMFDADPTESGVFGQVISFIHDPDGIFWRATSINEMLEISNTILETAVDEERQAVVELLRDPSF